MTKTNQDKIDNILAKNTDENGLYPAEMRRLKPKDCKIGDIVRTFNGQFGEIKEIRHNYSEHDDTMLILNNLRNNERLYAYTSARDGVFLTIWKLEQ
jgi:hypothetical protein